MKFDINYYKNLITSEHKNRPKFTAWLQAALQLFIDIENCANSLPSAFDVDIAVGNQLDVLGRYVGAPRTVGFQPSGGVSPTLDDNTYRLLILATIGKNVWDGTIDSIQSLWQRIFPGGQIFPQTNQDMSFNVLMSGAFSSIIIDLITHDYIVPRPQGVLMNLLYGSMPFFGFDRNDAYVAGFDVGKWI